MADEGYEEQRSEQAAHRIDCEIDAKTKLEGPPERREKGSHRTGGDLATHAREKNQQDPLCHDLHVV